MVLGAIAGGLGPRVHNVVLSRGYRDSPGFEKYADLSVFRYPNPAPESWKDYATGTRHVSFAAKICVAGLDVLCSLLPLRRLTREADLIHVHFPLPLGLSALAVRMLASRPLVVTVHGNADVYELPRALAPITRLVLRQADAVVSVSEDLAAHLASQLGVKRVLVIPNGIDADQFRPARASTETITLLSLSRLVPRKNVPVLIEAVGQLVQEGETRLVLLVAGTGPESEKIEQLAQARPGFVRFLGFVDEERKRALLAEADVFVQLSTREGLSIATLEALASGLPCIVSDRPGVREPITPGRNGWYVDDPESVESVVSALRRLLRERDTLDEMKRSARAIAKERYSLRRMCEDYWTVFTDVLERGGRA